MARMRRCAQEHVDTLTTAVHVGTSELQSGKHAEAAERLCVALPRLQRLVGEDAPVAIAAAANLAQALWQSGKPAEAADVYASVLRVEMRVKGAQHADTAATADELSRCLQLVADGPTSMVSACSVDAERNGTQCRLSSCKAESRAANGT